MKTLARTIACFLWLFLLLGCAGKSLRAESGFEEGKYEVLDTGLEQSTLYGTGTLGVWLDGQNFVVNALRDDPNARKDWLLRLVVVDTKSKAITLVREGVYLNCRVPKTGKTMLTQEGPYKVFAKEKKQWFEPCLSGLLPIMQCHRGIPAEILEASSENHGDP